MATITCTTRSGNDYRHYATTLAYLQDIDDGMPPFFKDVLANQVELDKHIPRSLQNHPPQRDLEINAVHEFTSHKVSDPWTAITQTVLLLRMRGSLWRWDVPGLLSFIANLLSCLSSPTF